MTTTDIAREESGGRRLSDLDDAALAEKAKTERAAFDMLYRRYARRVYGYCYSRTGNGQVAEDLTAQTFLRGTGGDRPLPG